MDATYKLNTLKYPLIVITTTDRRHQCFPLCYAIVSTDETTEIYKRVLKVFRESINILFK